MSEAALSVERCTIDAFLSSMRARSFPRFRHARLARHQEEAAARILEIVLRYGGAILADDVGLGKSYVAAAVAHALQRRGAAVELIVPASLRAQWLELFVHFELDATLLTHEAVARDCRVVDERQERIVIVDEAHRFRNPATQRFAALARRTIGARVLLVTATPLCNGTADLQALLTLCAADDALQHAGVGSIEEAFARRDLALLAVVVDALMVRRDRRVLPDALQFGGMERAVIRQPMPEAESPISTAIGALQFPLIIGSVHRSLLRKLLWRRLESSHAALLDSVRRQERFYRRVLDCLGSGRTLTRRDYKRALATDDEHDAMQQVLFWECFVPAGEASVTPVEVETELQLLRQLREHAITLHDEKLALLRSFVAETAEPLLIFTTATATARAIGDALRAVRPCGVATGKFALDANGRRAHADGVLASFVRGDLDVLIATDRSSEGLNLQRAGCVVHYDIPWNPVRLDQRNGRAHRIGQTRDSVRAVYFLPEREHDASGIVSVISAKNRLRRRMLPRHDQQADVVDVRGRMLLADDAVDATILLLDAQLGPCVVAERDGVLLDEAATGELLLALRGVEGETWPLDLDRCSAAFAARAQERISSRILLPSRLPRTHPAARFVARLRRDCLLDARCTAIARPFRAGATRLIEEMTREYLDRPRVDGLLVTLATEPPAATAGTVRVMAMIRVRNATG